MKNPLTALRAAIARARENWTWSGWWNADTRGVAKLLVALVLIAAASWALFGCAAYTPARLEVGIAAAVGSRPVVGHNPVGMVRLVQPVNRYVALEYLHLSSIPDFYDRATVDQVGMTITIPLGPVRSDR